MATISHHRALIYVMVIMSAVDRSMNDHELGTIGELVRTLPAFRDFDEGALIPAAQECAAILSGDGGLDAVLGLAAEALPDGWNETAYALACDVAAADERLTPEELRLLELIRSALKVDRLVAVAIERAASARYRRA